MSQLTFAPAVDFEEAVHPARNGRASRLRGILSGLVFLSARVPFYVGAVALAAVVCVVGVTLCAVHAGLGVRRG